MPTPVLMPKLGLTMAAGTLVRWLKAEGEPVRKGEPVAEIESDKAAIEVEAPADGSVGRHLVAPGTRVPVTTVICQILAAGEAEPPTAAPAPAPAAGKAAPAAAAAAPAPGATRVGDGPGDGAHLTPAARRVARELGLDLAEVARAFPAGRVTREEVEAWAASRSRSAVAAQAPPAPALAAQAPPAPAGVAGSERRPLSVMRSVIARRMVESVREAAQLTLTSEVDVTALVRFRTDLAPAFEQEYGYRPTYTDFLVKAMARAVPAVPQVNARWAGDAVELFPQVDVGVAVALDDGLIVPVVRGAQSQGLAAISRQVRDLAQRARQGRLEPGEASGSTITLTNLGPEGIDAFTPVLNPPEVAILGAGRVREVPALVGGQWVTRQVMTLSLTIDHRVVDGAPGARYLRRVAELLAQPALLVAG